MATVGYMTIKGASQGDISSEASTSDSIRGLWQSGHENECLVFQFEANAVVPRDPHSGSAISRRKHMPATFTKPLDKASPLLWQALATGESLELELKFERINTETGASEHYYTIKWEGALLVEGKTILPDVSDPANDPRGHIEEWSFAYRKVEWTHEVAGTSASDDYQNPS